MTKNIFWAPHVISLINNLVNESKEEMVFSEIQIRFENHVQTSSKNVKTNQEQQNVNDWDFRRSKFH